MVIPAVGAGLCAKHLILSVISVTMNHQKAISGEQRTNTTQQMGIEDDSGAHSHYPIISAVSQPRALNGRKQLMLHDVRDGVLRKSLRKQFREFRLGIRV